MSNSQNGKGDKRRPMQVSYDIYSKNWELAFGTKKKTVVDKKTKGK
jgi:hypothetical protein